MPSVLRSGPYRFYFFRHENNEPAHIHVDRDALSAKFWLNPISLAPNIGFNDRELLKIRDIVVQHKEEFLRAWHEHFADHRR